MVGDSLRESSFLSVLSIPKRRLAERVAYFERLWGVSFG